MYKIAFNFEDHLYNTIERHHEVINHDKHTEQYFTVEYAKTYIEYKRMCDIASMFELGYDIDDIEQCINNWIDSLHRELEGSIDEEEGKLHVICLEYNVFLYMKNMLDKYKKMGSN